MSPPQEVNFLQYTPAHRRLYFETFSAKRRVNLVSITPYLLYEDVGVALKFLSKAFGFPKYGAQNSGPDSKINHAAMQLGDDVIMMGYAGPKYKNPKRLGQATQSLYINVDDVDKHFERSKKAGAKIIEEPQDTFYGHAAMVPRIPRGIKWYFAQDIPRRTKARAPKKRGWQSRVDAI